MVDDKFNYASTSEEFSVEAENLKGESVREVAEAQEAQEENEQKSPETSNNSIPQAKNRDREQE
ncbi:MAG: hypothetical protein MUD14_15550 [Hydrococcus sp. Prado102]|jgi:hypothetical protein|nr:hypothetical protein [Hydrococcus sp. Prado102]